MRAFTAGLTVIAICLLAFPADVLAQSRGMFGPRTLGTSLQPPRSGQYGGVQLSPGGSFQGAGPYRGNGMFTTPWQRYSEPYTTSIASAASPSGFTILQSNRLPPGASAEAPLTPGGYQTFVLPAPSTVSFPQQAPTFPEATMLPEMAPQQQPEAVAPTQLEAGNQPAGQPAGNNQPAAGQPATTGAAAQPAQPPAPAAMPTGGAASYLPAQRPAFRYASALVTGASDAGGYLPQISERLMQIARDRGMQIPEGIQVYLIDGTAVLRGVVQSPHDQVLLGNMAALEPGIWRVSNQLTVAPRAASAR
jgi:hypothetical protein